MRCYGDAAGAKTRRQGRATVASDLRGGLWGAGLRFFTRRGDRIRRAQRALLYGDALGQVPRVVDVAAQTMRNMIGKELDGDSVEGWGQLATDRGQDQRVAGDAANALAVFITDGDDRAAAGRDLFHIRQQLLCDAVAVDEENGRRVLNRSAQSDHGASRPRHTPGR